MKETVMVKRKKKEVEKVEKQTDKKVQETCLEETKKEEVLTPVIKKSDRTCLDEMEREEVLKTVKLLLKSVKKDGKKSLLADDKEDIHLQFAMKKIPRVKNKIVKLRLPHSVWTPEQEICLFVKDIDKKSREHEVTERHFKDLLASKGIKCITQVIPLKCLKLEYKPFEAKINLSNMFDLFVADERIMRLLPPLLGKHFYGKKKHPIQVNLRAQDLKKEIEKAVFDSRCIISGQGATSTSTVGHSDMSAEHLADNVMKAVESIGASLPGGPVNIKNVYVRTLRSLALPLYATFSTQREVRLPRQPKKPTPVVGDLSTLNSSSHVLVTKMGEVKVGKLDTSGRFINMREKETPKRTTKRKMEDESDDEMHFEEYNEAGRKKRKTDLKHKKGKKMNSKKIKDKASPETGESVSPTASAEKENNESVKANPKKGKKKLSKDAPKKGKKVLSKAAAEKGDNVSSKVAPEKRKKISSKTAPNVAAKSMTKKSKITKTKKSKAVST